MTKNPRMIRVTSYDTHTRDSGRGGKESFVIKHNVWLDTHEVEMIKAPVRGPALYTVHMKSGKEFEIVDEDYNRIVTAMIAREESEAE